MQSAFMHHCEPDFIAIWNPICLLKAVHYIAIFWSDQLYDQDRQQVKAALLPQDPDIVVSHAAPVNIDEVSPLSATWTLIRLACHLHQN